MQNHQAAAVQMITQQHIQFTCFCCFIVFVGRNISSMHQKMNDAPVFYQAAVIQFLLFLLFCIVWLTGMREKMDQGYTNTNDDVIFCLNTLV
jgi:hypothetical protein